MSDEGRPTEDRSIEDGLTEDGLTEEGAKAPSRERSPRRPMCAGILTLEAITLGLTTPVLITVSDVDKWVALAIGLGLAVACIVVAGMLRAEWAYGLGWAIQVAAVLLGFLIPAMFFLGGIFAILWAAGHLLGRKIERERAEAWAAYEAGN
ncbi:hypothetical protein BJ980_001206 [Nocardioides daedukensis]|uniref:DUF4233 domain-containing protein n=1 Tax=Nocardioides daedukensis TaxID=634462 RepID=A0A7Y9S179_9ACTN|nr:DUF4233 domain-containing protein [Nocardioides daedukensis]NYG58283.1 hypothetical protein [Nocardioides daedukensis]